ncbi:unnamed protein product [Cuscuta epithymum]|uniref:Uncharacterized protein n=1 Tax=Cuscuta epithymum TaxID=186058 RepID=A0AAV0E2X2_9ASTE|nr:unnamed protein product [Cuscuta epithymum]
MASRAAYNMNEFLEVLSLKEQLFFHERKRQQQPSASPAGGGAHAAYSLSEALEAVDIQHRLAAIQKMVDERQSPSVFEFLGELLHTEPNQPSTGYASSTPATFSGGSEEASTAAAAYGGREPFEETEGNCYGRPYGRNEGRIWTRAA